MLRRVLFQRRVDKELFLKNFDGFKLHSCSLILVSGRIQICYEGLRGADIFLACMSAFIHYGDGLKGATRDEQVKQARDGLST